MNAAQVKYSINYFIQVNDTGILLLRG